MLPRATCGIAANITEGLGVRAIRTETPDEFVAVMSDAAITDGPLFIDALVQSHV